MFKFKKQTTHPHYSLHKKEVKLTGKVTYKEVYKTNKPVLAIDPFNSSKQYTQSINRKHLNNVIRGFSKNLFFRKKGFVGFFSKKILKTMSICILSKNLTTFKEAVRNVFFWTHYKKHRFLLLTLKLFFRKSNVVGSIFKGLNLVIKGRFMSPGGSKKRKKILKTGPTSLKKKTKSSIHNIPVRTPFGSLNMKLTIN